MRRILAPVLAVALAVGTLAASDAQSQGVEYDHLVELAVGDSATVDGGVPQGINPTYDHPTGETCSKDATTYCEWVLIRLDAPFVEEEAKKGRLRRNLSIVLTTGTNQLSDYDLMVYASDAEGTRGDRIGESTAFPYGGTSQEQVTTVITSTVDAEEFWVLAEMVYFSAYEAYSLDLSFEG